MVKPQSSSHMHVSLLPVSLSVDLPSCGSHKKFTCAYFFTDTSVRLIIWKKTSLTKSYLYLVQIKMLKILQYTFIKLSKWIYISFREIQIRSIQGNQILSCLSFMFFVLLLIWTIHQLMCVVDLPGVAKINGLNRTKPSQWRF